MLHPRSQQGVSRRPLRAMCSMEYADQWKCVLREFSLIEKQREALTSSYRYIHKQRAITTGNESHLYMRILSTA